MGRVDTSPQRRPRRSAEPGQRPGDAGLHAHALQLQEAIGNRAFTAVVQRQPVAEEKQAGGEIKARSVEKDIKIVGEGDLAATLKLPPNTIPPGAEKNPDFVRSLFDPDHHAFQLEEVQSPPQELVDALPEGELVEVEGFRVPVAEKAIAVHEGIEKGVEKMAKHGSEAAEAVEHGMFFKSSGRIFKATSYAYAVARIWEAPRDEKLEVAAEEGARIGGGELGSEAGVEACIALGVSTEGVGLIVCGVAGAIGGEKAADTVVETVINLLNAPQLIGEGLVRMGEILGELGAVTAALSRIPADLLGNSIVVAHEKMDPSNWDLRHLTPQQQEDARAVGTALWRHFGALKPDAFLTDLAKPLSALPLPAAPLARLMTPPHDPGQAGGAQAPAAPAAVDLSGLRPMDLVAQLQSSGLGYVQAPEYSAGFSGRWDDEAQLHVRLEPLVRERAEVNPGNWVVNRVPAVSISGGESVDLGPAIEAVGEQVWSRLQPLDDTRLPEQLQQPLKSFGVTRKAASDIAEGVNGLETDRILTLDADAILECTPGQFVELMQQFHVPLTFVREPHEVAAMTLDWVRKGFQPW